MWAISNQTQFKADRAFVRDSEGAEIWIVAVRATFSFDAHGRVTVAKDQQDVRLAPEYLGAPGRSSLRYDMDLVRMKSGTDVLVHAHAHAPGGRAAPHVDVGWTVGPLTKQLRVMGDRVWERRISGLAPSEPTPFVAMPIRYERAWGGPLPGSDARNPFNPVGTGCDAVPGKPVPNCELPEAPIRSHRHDGPPAGFGPIAYHWQPRARLAGTYDEEWKRSRQPLVPKDFQDTYLRCAPEDQQVDRFLSGGEEVVLRNLTPEGLVRFRLPGLALAFTTFIDDTTVHHGRSLHTVIIEPEDRRLIIIWQTALPCHHTLYTLDETVVFEKRRLLRETDTLSLTDPAA
ncbi:MAG: DUF2169 domain-containing protein [Byssovorax sp.]